MRTANGAGEFWDPEWGRYRRDDGRMYELPTALTVKDLAVALDAPVVELVKALMREGTMARIGDVLDYEQAATVAAGLGFRTERADER